MEATVSSSVNRELPPHPLSTYHSDSLTFHCGFYRLHKSLPSNLFEGVVFAIFNLGDRAYGPQFCAAGRKLAVRLLQLGAKLLCEPGYGDDGTPNGGVFADFDLWLQEKLLETVLKHGMQRTGGPVSLNPSPAYRVTVSESTTLTTDKASEEWQLERFAESYRSFFQSLCPLTAYSYDEETLLRVETRGDSSNKGEPPLLGRVAVNQRITAADWEQDTRQIRIGLQGKDDMGLNAPEAWDPASLPYRAGDVATVLPSNPPEEVERLLQVLPPDVAKMADFDIDIDNDSSTVDAFGAGCSFWPRRCTLRGWLTHCAHIHALPEREDLRALSFYCSRDHAFGSDQRDKLVSLSETSDAALYADYILREKRSWVDVLYDFDSLRAPGSLLTVEALLSLLAPIRPRDFSIASSPSKEWSTNQSLETKEQSKSGFGIELCVAVVQGTSPLGRSHHGLCSYYLSQRTALHVDGESGSLLRLWIRPGSFSGLPLDITPAAGTGESVTPRFQTPVLFIGAGTGIAPLRGLILEREAVLLLKSKTDGRPSVSASPDRTESDTLNRDNVLVFGCRKEKADFYYENDWKRMEESGQLGLLTAFSRDQWHKVYVQQRLRRTDEEHSLLARHIIEKSGSIYVAGGPKMARAVKEEIAESLAKVFDGGEKEALQFLARLQRLGRYSVEAWS